MPPIPPRRTFRDLLVPRDATETARQGRGIGDLEAMRQMATTAIPEVLRNAPATSTAMGAFDAARALADRDYGGAGMAALGMVPFAGALKYADEVADVAKSALRKTKALPMDEASRMARAAEQGYTTPVYHGTAADFAYPAFKMKGGGVLHEIPSAHVGTEIAANQRVMALEGLDEPPPLVSDNYDAGPRVMELLMKSEKPFYGFDPSTAKKIPLNEREIGTLSSIEYASKYGKLPDRTSTTQIKEATQLLRNRLLDEGYDVVPYINAYEDRGSTSYMVLKPENLRLKGAKFDPANIGKAGFMGALAGTLGLSAMGKANPEEQR